MFKDKAKLFITADEISKMCDVVAKKIDHDYKNKQPHLICVLKGSTVFFSDLIRRLQTSVTLDFVRLSSYGNATASSGVVRILKDISAGITGRHVIVIEDILDTGLTLKFLVGHLQASKPASIKLCTLLDKPSRRKTDISADYCGRAIEDKFVVGYGLDVGEKCRNYPDIWIMN